MPIVLVEETFYLLIGNIPPPKSSMCVCIIRNNTLLLFEFVLRGRRVALSILFSSSWKFHYSYLRQTLFFPFFSVGSVRSLLPRNVPKFYLDDRCCSCVGRDRQKGREYGVSTADAYDAIVCAGLTGALNLTRLYETRSRTCKRTPPPPTPL